MMAEAYHNETLRKQRVIDRALEARKRIEDQKIGQVFKLNIYGIL